MTLLLLFVIIIVYNNNNNKILYSLYEMGQAEAHEERLKLPAYT
jgi:hypothetical protein